VRLWPVFTLGNRFSGLVAIQQGHRLVTTGIYGVIGHPSYLGMLITVFGWCLRSGPAWGAADPDLGGRPHPCRGGAVAGIVRSQIFRLSRAPLA
jgi:hypothetical protein